MVLAGVVDEDRGRVGLRRAVLQVLVHDVRNEVGQNPVGHAQTPAELARQVQDDDRVAAQIMAIERVEIRRSDAQQAARGERPHGRGARLNIYDAHFAEPVAGPEHRHARVDAVTTALHHLYFAADHQVHGAGVVAFAKKYASSLGSDDGQTRRQPLQHVVAQRTEQSNFAKLGTRQFQGTGDAHGTLVTAGAVGKDDYKFLLNTTRGRAGPA